MKNGLMGDVAFVAVAVVAPLILIGWVLLNISELLQPLAAALK